MEILASFPKFIIPLWMVAYIVVTLLEVARRTFPADSYERFWGFLLVTTGTWAAAAIVQYVPRILTWREELFFLPGLVLAVVLAKLRGRMSSGLYFWVIILSILIFYFIARFVNDADLISGLFGPLRSNSNPFLGQLDPKTWGWIRWHEYWAPGVCLFAAVVVVAPRRRGGSMPRTIDATLT